jgi:hypothetical protein
MRVCVGLMCRVLNPGFHASYWSAGFGDISSGIGPCFPLTSGLCKFYANAGGKPLVISRNNKNKQLTLSSQRKLALTMKKHFKRYKSFEHLKNFKMAPSSI